MRRYSWTMSLLALVYHDVIHLTGALSGFVGTGADRFKVGHVRFAEHLAAVAKSGIAVSLVTERAKAPLQRLFLTFDDGGASASTTIAPMLAEQGWPGHFFVVTEQIGAPGFLGPDGIRELRAAGHVIGTHSHSHPNLARLPAAEIADEWKRSKAILEDLLGEQVDVASVPTGYYSDAVGREAVAAGLEHVFVSDPRLRPRPIGESGTLYGRFAVISTTPSERVERLCGLSRTTVLREASV